MKIFLIGYRCTGKTTIGKMLARRLNFGFTDTDHLIEKQTGLMIRQIVERVGWKKFRQIETQMLLSTRDKNNIVIATGGGIIMNPENQIFIKKNGTCIWLDADLKTILDRMKTDDKTDETRPSLTHQSILEETDELLKKRNPQYEATADIKINTGGLMPDEIVHMIERRLI